MNKHITKYALVIGGKVYVALKHKMLHDVTLHDVIRGPILQQPRSQGSLLPVSTIGESEADFAAC